MWWVRDGRVTELTLDPGDVGLEHHPVESLRGGDAAHNAQVARDLLAGVPGPVRDAVLLNAGIALATASGLGEPTVSRRGAHDGRAPGHGPCRGRPRLRGRRSTCSPAGSRPPRAYAT